MNKILFFILLLCSVTFAEIKSTKGNISFDVQLDGVPEMTLNSTGLGIGVTPSVNLHVAGHAIISNQLSIGGSSGSSNLNVTGSIGYGVQIVSSNTTLSNNSFVLVDSSSANITLILPYAGNVNGRIYIIKKSSLLNSVWLSGAGNLIEDTSPIELSSSSSVLPSVEVQSNGSQWYCVSSYNLSATVAAGNLVGWWKLDEMSGSTLYDSSGFNNHGVAVNMGTLSGCSIISPIKTGINFDGVDDYIEVPDSSDYKSNIFTYMAWVYPTTTSDKNHQMVLSKGQIPHSIYLSVGGLQVHLYHEGPSTWLDGTTAIPLNQWSHVVGSWDGVTRKIYLNGILDGSVADATTTAYENATPLRIGLRSDGLNSKFNGSIDDARIYNRALTPSEIQVIYQQGR